MSQGYYIGVDVGSGSVRACLVQDGVLLAESERPISREELKPNHITQSSVLIWKMICNTVQNAVKEGGINGSDVLAIAFDATCSLVMIDGNNEPMAVGPNFDNKEQDIIMWMDHRATKETTFINTIAKEDKCLKYVGGGMSVEMELPKIKWLQNQTSIKDAKFFDLPDYLTFKATGNETRSLCSTVCKQGLLPVGVDGSVTGWSKEFLEKVQLDELIENDFQALGGSISEDNIFLSAGQPVGTLNTKAAVELGLSESCVVSSGIIDAYSGWVGTVGSNEPFKTIDSGNICDNEAIKSSEQQPKMTERLAMVAGTSTCHIIISENGVNVAGVWGPYKDILVPGYWVTEGGQSCTGALLNYILTTHPAYKELCENLGESESPYDYLNKMLYSLQDKQSQKSLLNLTKTIFVYGDFHGNRSPLSDPEMRATIVGQSLDVSIESLALLYLASCEFIALQTRHILDTMIKAGHSIKRIYMSGSQAKNGLLMNLIVKATGLDIIIPGGSTSMSSVVAFGTSILAACAYNTYESKQKNKTCEESKLWEYMAKWTPPGEEYKADLIITAYETSLLNIKYQIYHDMLSSQKRYRDMIKSFECENRL